MRASHESATKWQNESATKWRNDVATGASPWNRVQSRIASPAGTAGGRDSATKWRNDIATGASPWNVFPSESTSPAGTAGGCETVTHVAPSGLGFVWDGNHGLTPVATSDRPFGTEIPRGSRCDAFEESSRLEEAMKSNLEALGYGG